jgi:hypothetical protein
MNEKVMQQMKKVRDSGRVNMMDGSRVQKVAHDMGFFALVTAIQDLKPRRHSPGDYVKLLDAFEEWLENKELDRIHEHYNKNVDA